MRFPNDPVPILKRVSQCCGATVRHTYPWNSESEDRVLALRCRGCGELCYFALVDERGKVVWEEPEDRPLC